MSSQLTTTTRFKAYAGITGSSTDSLISSLITQTSAQIERYLRRTLEATSYKVWIDGSGSPFLRLVEYPITALYQVSVSSSNVATVTNTSATVARASVSFDGTNLVLVEISTSGTETITELPVATSKTISALQAAINLKTGWSCALNSSDYETLPTAFLRPIYGQNASDDALADLCIPDAPVPAKILHEDMIEIVNSEIFPSWDIFPNDRLPNRMSSIQPGITPPTFSYGFPSGSKNIFVWFKAGYTLPSDASDGPPAVAASDGTLPAGLALLVHQIIQDTLSSTKINSNMQSESIGDYSYSLRATADGAIASAIENRKRELNQYRKVSI